MKSMSFDRGGDSHVLSIGQMMQPTPAPDQILVNVRAAGINPIDTKIRSAPERFPVTLPCIPGCDAAGIVIEVGAQVKNFKSGDEVYFAQPPFNQRQGSCAEFVAVDASLVAHKPASLSFEQAAAAPLVLITAWEALHDRAEITAGDKVLIHAGAGGVGHIAVQLALKAGADVMATVSSEEKAAFVRSLGAQVVVNYQQQNIVDEVMQWTNGQGVDIALDTVGGAVLESCFTCAKPYSDVVSILQPDTDTDWSLARKRNLRFSFELMLSPVMMELESAKAHQGWILEQCRQMFDAGELKIEVAKVFELVRLAEAQDFLVQERPVGKVVVTM